MSSIAIQINSLHGCPSAHSFPSRKPISCNQSLVGFPVNAKPSSIFHSRTTPPSSRTPKFEAFAAPETMAPVEEEEETQAPPLETERAEVVVKKVEKPRLVLKFIWMEKNIGLGLDQVIPGHGSVPLSPYFFWPRKDAWEELKAALESKPWISQKKMIILLNQATDIINLWQQSGGNLT